MKRKLKLFPINRDNVFKATAYTIILSATGHLLGSLYMAVREGNPDLANMFNIIGLGLFFPGLSTGALNSLLGVLFVIAIGIWFYAMQQWHDQNPNGRKRPF